MAKSFTNKLRPAWCPGCGRSSVGDYEFCAACERAMASPYDDRLPCRDHESPWFAVVGFASLTGLLFAMAISPGFVYVIVVVGVLAASRASYALMLRGPFPEIDRVSGTMFAFLVSFGIISLIALAGGGLVLVPIYGSMFLMHLAPPLQTPLLAIVVTGFCWMPIGCTLIWGGLISRTWPR